VSDNFLRLIPTDPEYTPDAQAADEARAYLATLVPDADEVKAAMTSEIAFIDQGANFERISCPRCGAEIDESWWADEVERASNTAFAQLDVITPCCAARVSLNDLDYRWPAGFARFVLEAMNPQVRDLDESATARLAAMLGTPLRRIWAHY